MKKGESGGIELARVGIILHVVAELEKTGFGKDFVFKYYALKSLSIHFHPYSGGHAC